MRNGILWGVAGLAAATMVACAEGEELAPEESDVISQPDASVDGAASSGGKSSSSGGVGSSSGTTSSGGITSTSSSGEPLDAGEEDAASADAGLDAGGSSSGSSSSSSSSSGAVPPAPAKPILHSVTCDRTEIDSLEGLLRITLSFSDVNADYKELTLKLVYPDGYSENKPPIPIPAGYDGDPGPVTMVQPITLRVGSEGAYQLFFRVKDDTNRLSDTELRVIVEARD